NSALSQRHPGKPRNAVKHPVCIGRIVRREFPGPRKFLPCLRIVFLVEIEIPNIILNDLFETGALGKILRFGEGWNGSVEIADGRVEPREIEFRRGLKLARVNRFSGRQRFVQPIYGSFVVILAAFDQPETSCDLCHDRRLLICLGEWKRPHQVVPGCLQLIFIDSKGPLIEEYLAFHTGRAFQGQSFSFRKANAGFLKFSFTSQKAALQSLAAGSKLSCSQFWRRRSVQQMECLGTKATHPEIYVRQQNPELVVPDRVQLFRLLEPILCFTRRGCEIAAFELMCSVRVECSKIRLALSAAGQENYY